MTLQPFRLEIETAENGFLVCINRDFSSGAMRPKPYVFENMETLLDFVKKTFPKEKSAFQRMEEMYKPRQ